MVSLSSFDAVRARVFGARRVELGAYVLRDGAMVRALDAAAALGADVAVTLPRTGVESRAVRAANRRTAGELRRAGVHVRFARRPFHLKAAVIDGAAFLDDRNWASGGCSTVVTDEDPRDVAAVRAALRGGDAPESDLALRKDVALAREAALIAAAGDRPVVVASEAFSAGIVADVVAARARAGKPTTLVVNAETVDAREARLLRALRRDGVTVRTSVAREKYVLAGDAAWVGSANATGGAGDQVEWGAVVRDPALVASLRRRAEDQACGVAAGAGAAPRRAWR